MGRKRPGEGHPGLTKELLRMADASESLRMVPGWDFFNPAEKEFLCLVTWYSSKSEPSSVLGKSANWVGKREQINPAFKAAVAQRQMLRQHVLESMGSDMLGASMMRLWEMVQKDFENKAIQLQAIKHLHSLMGYADTLKDNKRLPGAHQQTYINANSITMFDGVPRKQYVRDRFNIREVPTEIVEGAVTEDASTEEAEDGDIADLISATTPVR